MTAPVIDDRPGAAAFSRRCRGRTHPLVAPGPASTDPIRAELARQYLVTKLLRRRTWAVHRQVHLRAAFEDAASRAPIESVLSVGCGSATSELLLAVDHPEVSFTLSDHDEEQLAKPRAAVRRFGLDNVRVERIDLLDPEPLPTHDLVVSIEVLEHIEDDVRALQTMRELSRRFVWVLVPFCDENQIADPRVCRSALERHEHVRPGYTHSMLADRFAWADTLWQRNCYFQPGALALRRRMTDSDLPRLLRDRKDLFDLAVGDVRGRRVDDGHQASGIEILVATTEGGSS